MTTTSYDRRQFLQTAAVGSAGLVLAFYLPGNPYRAAEAMAAGATPESAAVNTWLRIAPDGVVTVYVARSEMGQGVFTAMPMLVAEELEADWTKVRVEPAPSAAAFNYTGAPIEVTGGSTSVRTTWDVLLRIGATARELLVAAAALEWGVGAAECQAAHGAVTHAKTGKKAGYGELAAKAAALPVPKAPKMKDPKHYRLVGKSTKRLDTPAKVRGEPLFGIDVALPEMLCGAVRVCPQFGGDVANFAAIAQGHPAGVTVVKVPNGVAVVTDSYWKAQRIANDLPIRWTRGATDELTTAKAEKRLRGAVGGAKNPIAALTGHAEVLYPKAPVKVSAEYQTPFLAHTPMEPLNCTADVRDGEAAVWVGTQSHTLTKLMVSKHLGLPQDRVTVHTTYLGGGFGRRAESDMVIQAVEASKAVKRPVKLIWSREEDVQHDFYRPASAVRMQAGLEHDGRMIAFKASIASSSIMKRWEVFGGLGKDGVDATTVEGLRDIKYACPNTRVDAAAVDLGVPVGFWRSVGSSHNAFFVESFVDEMAYAVQQDPYQYRRALLQPSNPRFVGVLDTVAKMAKWGAPLPEGRHHGIAVHESFGSIVAEVAEVSVAQDGTPTVHKVFVAVDCGRHVNPDTIVAQMESGVVYGLGAALYGEITLKDGRVEQSNFHDYPMLAPDAMPVIEVEIVTSGEAPGGVGEPGTPPIAPAVTNAIFAATGKRIRSLPILKRKTGKTG